MTWYDETLKRRRLVTPELLLVAIPRCPDAETWAYAFDAALDRFDIRDRDEIAQLLAHVGHESSDLNRLEESLYYRAERLMQVWPRRFPTLEAARPYARNPEALANNVYANRMGNGDESSGDGYRFIGRGPIQITGRYNYSRLSNAIDINVVSRPQQLVSNPYAGALSACWYWSEFVGPGTIRETTRRINGGHHGLADRTQRYERARKAIV